MHVDLSRWHPDVVALLHKAGQLPMPIVHSDASEPSAAALKKRRPADLFPGAKSAEALLAGLLLRLNCWKEAHEVAQDIASPEGSYWHAIVHRMEPDYGNAAYWFRRVGKHPIFPQLLSCAENLMSQFPQVNFAMPDEWRPEIFLRFCQEAASKRGSNTERLALAIQQVEWELLMEWCG
jgi:hypothetical protein